jgi:hypothetical protein
MLLEVVENRTNDACCYLSPRQLSVKLICIQLIVMCINRRGGRTTSLILGDEAVDLDSMMCLKIACF